jgi:hypothetical protein
MSRRKNHKSPVTPGTVWRKQREGLSLVLPSGNQGLFRAVGFEQVLLSESIPDLLTAVVDELINATTEDEAQAVVDRVTGALVADTQHVTLETVREQLRQKRAFLELFCAPMFVTPRLVAHAQADDELEIADVTTEDLEFLFQFFGAPVSALVRFPAEQETALESVGATEGDAPISE